MGGQKFVPQGTLILEQGAVGDNAYVITSGKVGISMQDQHGDEIFLAELGPGSLIGEMAVLLGGGRRANARAQEDVVLNVIPGSELRETSQSSHSMNDYLMALIERRRHDMQMALYKQRQAKYSG